MFVIGIAGGSGSGKTTFAKKVANLIAPPWKDQVGLVHQDAYYCTTLPTHLINEHQEKNVDHPDAFDWSLLKEHLTRLEAQQAVACPIYDFITSKRSLQVDLLGPCKVVVLEGIYALWEPTIRAMLDLKIYLHVDADVRFIRRLHRDVKERGRTLETVIHRYYTMVRPMHLQHLEPTSQFADFIIGEDTDTAAQVIAAKIHQQLGVQDLRLS